MVKQVKLLPHEAKYYSLQAQELNHLHEIKQKQINLLAKIQAEIDTAGTNFDNMTNGVVDRAGGDIDATWALSTDGLKLELQGTK